MQKIQGHTQEYSSEAKKIMHPTHAPWNHWNVILMHSKHAPLSTHVNIITLGATDGVFKARETTGHRRKLQVMFFPSKICVCLFRCFCFRLVILTVISDLFYILRFEFLFDL